jgi:hypothetical protein
MLDRSRQAPDEALGGVFRGEADRDVDADHGKGDHGIEHAAGREREHCRSGQQRRRQVRCLCSDDRAGTAPLRLRDKVRPCRRAGGHHLRRSESRGRDAEMRQGGVGRENRERPDQGVGQDVRRRRPGPPDDAPALRCPRRFRLRRRQVRKPAALDRVREAQGDRGGIERGMMEKEAAGAGVGTGEMNARRGEPATNVLQPVRPAAQQLEARAPRQVMAHAAAQRWPRSNRLHRRGHPNLPVTYLSVRGSSGVPKIFSVGPNSTSSPR